MGIWREWSGELALALAVDGLGDADRAQRVYQTLKFKLVGRLSSEGWELSENQLIAAIKAIERGQNRER